MRLNAEAVALLAAETELIERVSEGLKLRQCLASELFDDGWIIRHERHERGRFLQERVGERLFKIRIGIGDKRVEAAIDKASEDEAFFHIAARVGDGIEQANRLARIVLEQRSSGAGLVWDCLSTDLNGVFRD